jgi:hypothetical protein
MEGPYIREASKSGWPDFVVNVPTWPFVRKYYCFDQEVLVNLNRSISLFRRFVCIRPYRKKALN